MVCDGETTRNCSKHQRVGNEQEKPRPRAAAGRRRSFCRCGKTLIPLRQIHARELRRQRENSSSTSLVRDCRCLAVRATSTHGRQRNRLECKSRGTVECLAENASCDANHVFRRMPSRRAGCFPGAKKRGRDRRAGKWASARDCRRARFRRGLRPSANSFGR